MKIEMGESLFYSWLRHVKECQIVQTNWKVSTQWQMENQAEIQSMYERVDTYFREKYNYNVFKKNSSLSQILQQGECDVLGSDLTGFVPSIYSVDVAFHEGGLNYGSKDETIMKVIAKLARTAFCLYGYLNGGCDRREVIFASPKINPAIMEPLERCVSDLNAVLNEKGDRFHFRIIANEAFDEQVLQPILLASRGIADTSELFVRSYQLFQMFAKTEKVEDKAEKKPEIEDENERLIAELEHFFDNSPSTVAVDTWRELKIGKLVQLVLKPLIVTKATDLEILQMMEADYSKATFGIQYPLLLKTSSPVPERHYYSELFEIRGETYRLCCEWYETSGNNDRPFVEQWIREHQ